MRPVHEVLEACKPYLYPHGTARFICRAIETIVEELDDPPEFTIEEIESATEAVMHAVHKLDPESTYLRNAAAMAGLLPEYISVTHPTYIAFRDKWLDNLIEEYRNAVPEPATQPDQPAQ